MTSGRRGTTIASWPHRTRWRTLAIAALGILIALVPVASLLWHRRLPHNSDIFRYHVLAEFFSEAISAGVWYPRWIPDMNGGYGYPQFVFYQPGYFYVSHLFAHVDAPTLRCVFTLGTVALVGALGAYRLIRGFAGPLAGLFCLLMFQLTPYHFTDIYGRGDLSEWIALQLSPWPLYFLRGLAQSPVESPGHPWHGVGLAVALAAMGYAHPITYILFLPALVAMASGLGVHRPACERFVYMQRLAAAVLIGLSLSSPYWLTVVTMKQFVNIRAVLLSGHFDPLTHVLSPIAFFSSNVDPLSRRLGLSFELGLIHFVLAVVGAWLGRKEPFVVAAFAIYVLLLALMTPVAAQLWLLYPFYLMQFPWRLLAVSAIFQLVCMLGIIRRQPAKPWPALAIAVAVILVTGFWHSDELTFKPMPTDIWESPEARRLVAASFPTSLGFLPVDVATPTRRDIRNAAIDARRAAPYTVFATLDGSEWAPSTALSNPLRLPRGEPLVEPLNGAVTGTPTERSTRFRLDLIVDATGPSTVVLNQLYLPGWKLSLDGRGVPDEIVRNTVNADGRMTLRVGPGRHRLEAWYDGPPGWLVRTLGGFVLTGVCILWLFWPWAGRRP